MEWTTGVDDSPFEIQKFNCILCSHITPHFFFMCLAILLQIFVPKLLMHQQSLHYTRMNGMQFGVPMIWQDEQHSLLNFKMPCWVSVQRTCNKELIK